MIGRFRCWFRHLFAHKPIDSVFLARTEGLQSGATVEITGSDCHNGVYRIRDINPDGYASVELVKKLMPRLWPKRIKQRTIPEIKPQSKRSGSAANFINELRNLAKQAETEDTK